MKTSWHWLLALALATPAFAQEEAPAEEAEVVPIEEPAAEESAPADEAPAAAAAEEAPAEEEVAAEGGGESSGDGEPWVLYAGADLVTTFLSPSAGSELESGMYRLHFGARPFESLNIEVQGGIHEGSDGPGEYRTENYFGVFLVPHIDAMWVFDLAFPVGYADTAVETRSGGKDEKHSVAYGLDATLRMRAFSETAPDLGLTFGGMVYYQKSDARIYGFHFGLNYGFGG